MKRNYNFLVASRVVPGHGSLTNARLNYSFPLYLRGEIVNARQQSDSIINCYQQGSILSHMPGNASGIIAIQYSTGSKISITGSKSEKIGIFLLSKHFCIRFVDPNLGGLFHKYESKIHLNTVGSRFYMQNICASLDASR